MNQPFQKWICCQLGARQHYAVPRALHRSGALERLITDVWVPPNSFWRRLPNIGPLTKLKQRYNPDLKDAQVDSFNGTFAAFESLCAIRNTSEWHRIMARNRLYERSVVGQLRSLQRNRDFREKVNLFCYSYAALEILRYAKALGWHTVLEQIDPGPVEMNVVRLECARYFRLDPIWEPPPSEYWTLWREECELADKIIVNSQWSLDALREVGVPSEKLHLVPLAFEPPKGRLPLPKTYPAAFNTERPLRVLFLGQINLRKGVARLLEAAHALREEPVEFWMVGPVQIGNLDAIGETAPIKWLGPVARANAAEYYKQADVFILPTLSDGFALTQIESLANSLPVITSRFCGEVVRDGVDGIVLSDLSGEAIASALRRCLRDPAELDAFSRAAGVRETFELSTLGRKLANLVRDDVAEKVPEAQHEVR